MATFNFTDGSLKHQVIPPQTELSQNKYTARRNIIDCAENNLAAADVAQVIFVPAGTEVLTARVRVITADAAQTINIGTAADDDAFGAGVSGATADAIVGGLIAPVYFAADGYILLTVPSAMSWDTLKVEIVAEMRQANNSY